MNLLARLAMVGWAGALAIACTDGGGGGQTIFIDAGWSTQLFDTSPDSTGDASVIVDVPANQGGVGGTVDASVADGNKPADGGTPMNIPTDSCAIGTPCGSGGTCWKQPAGNLACVAPAPVFALPACDGLGGGGPTGPCCAASAECTVSPGGRCVPATLDYCGGAHPGNGGKCLYDECARDADCSPPGTVCAPAGVNGSPTRRCLPSACHSNADCTRGPEGRCALAAGSCGGASKFHCFYANDLCRNDQDCPKNASQPFGLQCAPDTDGHGTICVPRPPLVP